MFGNFFGKAKPVEDRLFLGMGTGIKVKEKPFPIYLTNSHRSGHMLCAATTRSGKTRLAEWMMELDIRAGRSVVFLDPKGDLDALSKVYQIAEECGRLDDFMLVTPIWPEYSAKIDPLCHYRMPEELVNHITSGVSDGKGDVFFTNVAYEISLAITLSKLLIARHSNIPTARFSLMEVMEYISQDALKGLRDQIHSIKDPEARQLENMLSKIIESPPDYFGKISSSLRVAMVELCAGNIGKIIGTAEENRFINRLEQGKQVIMVVQLGAMITQKAALTVGKLIISMINTLCGRFYSNGRRLTPELCVYIDEAQNVLTAGIDNLLSKAGGAGIYCHLFVQSVNQIYSVMGKDAGNSILSNLNTKLFMRVPDPQTATMVCEHFGTRKLLTAMMQMNSSDATIREVEEDLLQPANILNLQPRQFYMTTYNGNFQGVTAAVGGADVKFIFPDINSAVLDEDPSMVSRIDLLN
jgi:conjugal transfer pilus assembly protein TraD